MKQESKTAAVCPSTKTTHGGGSRDGVRERVAVQCDSNTDDKPKPSSTDASVQRFFAESWVAANGVVWSWIKSKAKEYAKNRRPFSMQQLLSMARYSGEVEHSDQDPDFKVNNTSIPALSRLLDEQCPEVEPFHEKRRSKCDWSFTSEGKQ
jgi:hypothetical protein